MAEAFGTDVANQSPNPGTDDKALSKGKAKQAITDRLSPRLIDIRSRRRSIDEEDLRNHAAWKGVRTRFFYDSDNFKHYIPAARRSIERFTSRAVQMLMPTERFFEVYPGDELSLQAGKQADGVRAYLDWLLTAKIKIRPILTQLTRCLLLYGRCVAKNVITTHSGPVSLGRFRGKVTEILPTMKAVDTFSFYQWPETVPAADAQILFEDVMMPYSDYQMWVTRKIADNISQDDLLAPEWPYAHKQRLSLSGLTEPTAALPGTDGTQVASTQVTRPQRETFVALSEVWFQTDGQWYQAWLVWNLSGGVRCTRLQRSEYLEPPYRTAYARPIPGEAYTSGMMHDLEGLQILLNDQFNQGEEARSISALPPVIIDPNLVPRTDSLLWGARKKWYIEQPGVSVKMLDIPDTSQTSQRAQQLTLTLMNTVTGDSPLIQGQPTRGLPRAGQAVQNMISLGLADVSDVAQIIEQEILTPSLADLWRLTLAFVPKSQMLRIPGTSDLDPQSLSVQDLVGNWSFKWVGSQQAQNMQVKSQQLLMFLQTAQKVAPIMQQQGWVVNWGPLMKRIWRDGLGERGAEQIVVPMTELATVNPAAADGMQQQIQQQMMMQMGGPGGNAGGPQPPGQPPASEADAMGKMARQTAEPSIGQMMSGG